MSGGSKKTARTTGGKAFFVCAWNGLTELDQQDAQRWQSDPMARAVASYLSALGWDDLLDDRKNESTVKHTARVVEAEKRAALVVVVLRDRDKPLSLAELSVFHTGLNGKKKKVLYIHIVSHSPFAQGCMSDWLFRVSRCDGITRDLKDWLDEKDEKQDWRAAASAQFKFRRRYGKYCGKARRRVKDAEWPSRTARKLITSPSLAQFFFGLCRISARYNRLEHDLSAGGAASARTTAKKQYLDQCFDLHGAIAARCVVDACHGHCSDRLTKVGVARNIILLIDDHPERHGCDKEIAEVIKNFLPGFEFWIWNTEKFRGYKAAITQGEAEVYSSWKTLDEEQYIAAKPWINGEVADDRESLGLNKLLARTRIVLVDVLFQDAGGDDVEAGYGIIRGIHRICRDRHLDVEQLISTELQRQNEEEETDHDPREDAQWHLPEIIAISRASDQDKAQTVYRYGASGFVLKQRTLGLPAAIARSLRANYDPASTTHRNFRLLYTLPQETIGLLRSSLVPRTPLHGPRNVNDKPADGTPDPTDGPETPRHRQNHRTSLAQMIACLPKTDLHVHPGSCMTPDYLVLASFFMLLRQKLASERAFTDFADHVDELWEFWEQGAADYKLIEDLAVDQPDDDSAWKVPFDRTTEVKATAKAVRTFLEKQVDVGETNRERQRDPVKEERYVRFRSILHKDLHLHDHKHKRTLLSELGEKKDVTLFFFAITHAGPNGKPPFKDQDDVLRLFILWLASRYSSSKRVVIDLGQEAEDEISTAFSAGWLRTLTKENYEKLHDFFFEEDGLGSVRSLRDRNWQITRNQRIKPGVQFRIEGASYSEEDNFLGACPSTTDDPIACLIASGTRSTNLREYLEGCEYSGAEHLKHPFLMHLFAQQTVHQFVRHGVLYAELRAAISGYENKDLGFTFSNACHCFCAAFGEAQGAVKHQYHGEHAPPEHAPPWLWQEQSAFSLRDLFDPFRSYLARFRFPCKVSVILTGKRDKPTRLLLREAGAGAVLYSRPQNPADNACDFVNKAVPDCRVVGFDLAGQEEGHPPHHFRSEYDQIARMHIPITVHAGENADETFVESAIIDLRARRLGHGLSLADDDLLMARARDDGVCVELCPVSNFQTNAVAPFGEAGAGRVYPLRTFLEAGINVCINTDNPIISYTNMVKECFQASYAYGKPGLSLWELLRILRLGFTQSFLTLPERRALIELADQLVFDLFSKEEVLGLLRVMSFRTPPTQPSGGDP